MEAVASHVLHAWCIYYLLASSLRGRVALGAVHDVREIYGSNKITHRRKLIENALAFIVNSSK